MSAVPSAVAGVKSATRVFDILELFARERRELSASEVSQLCGYPQSSTSELLRTMAALGYLHFDRGERTYMPTARVNLLGNWIGERLFHEGRTLALMRDIRDQTGQTVILGTENGLRAQYIHVIEGTAIVRMHAITGTLRPLAKCGTGLLILSTYPDSMVRKIIRRLNAESAAAEDQVSIPDLMDKLTLARQRGYAISMNLVLRGGGTIATELPERANGRLLVVAIAASDTVLVQQEKYYAQVLKNGIERHFS